MVGGLLINMPAILPNKVLQWANFAPLRYTNLAAEHGVMFALSFIAFFLLAVVVTLVYARRLYRLVEYSNSNRVSIFGNRYTSSFTLLADFYFLVELAKGSKVESEPDDELRSRLVAIRKLFLLQLLFGAMMIISFNLNAFLR